jgi:MFS transporter, DHA1 family, multidrug resistance protein
MLRPDTFALTAMLAALTAIAPLSTDLYLPSLPEIGRAFGASASQVQLTLSAYLFGFAAGQIVYGPLSDRHGRRPILLGALALYCLASLICTLAGSIEILIGARFLQAFGGAGAIVLARAVVRDIYSGARAGKELSLMGAIMALAPVLAPLAGAGLQHVFGWRAAFAGLLGVGLLATLIVWRILPETLQNRVTEPVSVASMLRTYRSLLGHRSLALYVGIVSASYAGLFCWLSSAAFILQDFYGLSPVGFAAIFTLGSLGFMTGASIATRLVGRLGLERTIGLGAVVMLAGGLVMMLILALELRSAAALVLPMALYLVGLGLTFPQAMAGGMTPFPERAGAASSVLGFVSQLAAAVIGALVVAMLDRTAWPLALSVTAMGVLTLLFWSLLPRVLVRPTG